MDFRAAKELVEPNIDILVTFNWYGKVVIKFKLDFESYFRHPDELKTNNLSRLALSINFFHCLPAAAESNTMKEVRLN